MGVGGISIWQLLIVSVIVVVIYVSVRSRQAAMKTWGSTSTSSHQQSNSNSQTSQSQNSPQVSVGIIIIYSVVTWVIISALAKGYVELVMAPRFSGYSMSEAQPFMWSWASALMGIFLALRLKRWGELLWGGVFFVACLVPPSIPSIGRELGGLVSIAMGIGYFSWCYVKLEKDRLSARLLSASHSESNVPHSTQVNIIIPTKEEPHLQPTEPVEQLNIEDSVDPPPSDDIDLYDSENDDIYEKVWDELESDSIDRGLWSRLYAKYGGDTEKLNAAYITVRADQLINERKKEELGREERYQAELEKWTTEKGWNKSFHLDDLRNLRDELSNDLGDSRMWTRAVVEAKKFGRYPEEAYRIARLTDLRNERKGWNRKKTLTKKFRKN